MRLVGSEEELCLQLARYIAMKHPEIKRLCHFDFGSGTKLSMSQAVRQRRLNDPGWPDLFIAVPVMQPGTINMYYGLFIELKREGTRLKKKDGSWASPHIAEQYELLVDLAGHGFIAQFAVGLDEAIRLIESYMAGRHQAAA